MLAARADRVPAPPAAVGRNRGAQAHMLAGDRLFLHQGPINLIIKAHGSPSAVRDAYSAACRAFDGLLAGLVDTLTLLRQPVTGAIDSALPLSPTARRMRQAVAPYAATQTITPMAAVAGAVADTITDAIANSGAAIDKCFVNNGGDIALWFAPNALTTPPQVLDIGVVDRLTQPPLPPRATLRLRAGDGVGGVATSGWDGHSYSLGIADAVTVLADSAAAADAAATLIGNATNAEHRWIERHPACDLDPDSDLGQRLVVTGVRRLPPGIVDQALDRGAAFAEDLLASGLIRGALLAVQQRWRTVGDIQQRLTHHA